MRNFIQLILMDICMPRMDGVSAVRALRADPRTRDVPVIMVTSKSDEARVQEGYAAGCTSYVTKPIEPIQLRRRVEALLARGTDSVAPDAADGP